MQSPPRAMGPRANGRAGLLHFVLACLCLGGHGARAATPASTADSTAGVAAPASAPLDSTAARVMVDSLLQQVASIRGLEPLRPVAVQVAARERIRARLEELTQEEEVRSRARGDERLLHYLGLLPPDVELLQLLKDLLEEQIAGMYDIDQRLLYLADWVPAELQTIVATHEITHALQDQHFSLRVRKKLGFATADAEAAWQALLEGDATAVMLEAGLRPVGQSFAALADSNLWTDGTFTAALREAMGAGAGMDAGRLFSAPAVVRESLLFPYEKGLGFVAALVAAGGWKRVDEAYVHPPESTEQVLHPARFLGVSNTRDEPVRVETPDVRGLLGTDRVPAVKLVLGEFDLYLYLSAYVEREIAAISCEGWGGAQATLYAAPGGGPEALVLYTTWDSEDDATEFFGAVLGAMEKRFPKQTGVPEMTTENRVAWSVDEKNRFQNLVGQNGRDVYCLEQVPASSAERLIQKLEQQTRLTDTTPEARAEKRDELPWNRASAQPPPPGSRTTLHLDLPPGWQAQSGRPDLLALAERAGARLEVGVDRAAKDRLGAGGYAHVLASRLQEHASGVYVHTDVVYPRADGRRLYQHVFSQTENGQKVVHYIGVVELEPGFGYVLLTEPQDGKTPSMDADFYAILEALQVVPEGAARTSSGNH